MSAKNLISVYLKTGHQTTREGYIHVSSHNLAK